MDEKWSAPYERREREMEAERSKSMLRSFLWLVCILGGLSVLSLFPEKVRVAFHPLTDTLEYYIGGNELILGDDAVNTEVVFPIRPPEEVDFLPRDLVLEKRIAAVADSGKFLRSPYSPSNLVFGAIEDRKPWWGVHGLYYFGPGAKGIEGPSEETRFLLNPFLLVGLGESTALIVKTIPSDLQTVFPEATRLSANFHERRSQVRYRLGPYLNHLDRYAMHAPEESKVSLIAYNARDMGFRYLAVVKAESRGVLLPPGVEDPVPLVQFIHRGMSCGYPGGCNNMSPFVPQFEIGVKELPGRLFLKLWREDPKDRNKPSDLEIILELEK